MDIDLPPIFTLLLAAAIIRKRGVIRKIGLVLLRWVLGDALVSCCQTAIARRILAGHARPSQINLGWSWEYAWNTPVRTGGPPFNGQTFIFFYFSNMLVLTFILEGWTNV
jgi:hypothetical protein